MPIETAEEMVEEGMPEEGMEETEVSTSTAVLPGSIMAGKTAAAGDQITLEVVEVGEDGSLTVRYPETETKAKGVDALAAAFD